LILLFDEFGDAGRVPNMAAALALYRSKNVAIVAGIQTYSLMEAVYREDWKAVRDGFGTLIVMTANLPDEMQGQLTRQLGQRSEVHSGLAVQLNSGGPSLTVSAGSDQARDLVPLDQWGAWSEGHACLVRGRRPTWWVPRAIPLVG
jgi:type IV secretory pathway TraG/TraD family ATPase VirD4